MKLIGLAILLSLFTGALAAFDLSGAKLAQTCASAAEQTVLTNHTNDAKPALLGKDDDEETEDEVEPELFRTFHLTPWPAESTVKNAVAALRYD
jgi:hypothetical protein